MRVSLALVFSYEEVRKMSEQESDIQDYIVRYCKTYNISREEAEKQLIVKDVTAYYIEKYEGKMK